jgi:glyoxylase-like metal-dependent hydrolase (beta-lactamase superfamily II)
MKEIAPGLFHWTALHPKLGFPVSSYFVQDSGTLLDPMVPADGLGWFHEHDHRPESIVLSNRHHDRQAKEFCDAFALAPVHVPEPGLHEFADKDLEVSSYAAGEEVVSGIVVHEVGAIAPDDMALEIRSVGALAMADALVHFEDGVRFVRDDYMDDPENTKVALAQSLENLLDIDFDILLFAHGEPIVGGGKRALRDFLASQPAA